MINRLKRIAAIFIMVPVLFFSGCVERFTGEDTDLDSVKLITPEEIESIFAAISAEVTEKYPVETDDNGRVIVFWLEGGSVWHSSKECGNIKKADPAKVLSGTVYDALQFGKERACKICTDDDDAASENDVIDTDSMDVFQITETTILDINTTVYWVQGGSVWHLNQSCRSLSKADINTIVAGSVNEAYRSGKTRGCKVCAKNVEFEIVPDESKSTDSETYDDITDEVSVEKYPKEYDSEGNLIVFWTESGKVWHECRHCSSLSRSNPDQIFSGSESDAVSSGKERACKNCS